MRQRCLVHKERNLAKKVKGDQWPAFKAHAKACYEAPSPEVARMLREREFPSAVQGFLEDFEACIAYLRFPVAHRRSIRTTNLLERLWEEDRRRTKVMPHAVGERALLKVMFAAVIRASAKWGGLKTTAFEQARLAAIREELTSSRRL